MDIDRAVKRLKFADKRWCKAMRRKGYRDDPDEQPFTPREAQLYKWADAWRRLYHRYEALLYTDAGVRRGMLEGLNVRQEATQYVSDAVPSTDA